MSGPEDIDSKLALVDEIVSDPYVQYVAGKIVDGKVEPSVVRHDVTDWQDEITAHICEKFPPVSLGRFDRSYLDLILLAAAQAGRSSEV